MFIQNKVYYLLIGFLGSNIYLSFGQDQKVADSLVHIYQENRLKGSDKLELLRNLSFNELHDIELAKKYVEELIALARSEHNNLYLYRGYLQKGDKYEKTGDLEVALDAYFKSAESAMNAEFPSGEGTAYMSIADVYSVMGNSVNAEIYYNKAIDLLRTTNDSISLASALLNAGDEFINARRFENALAYFEEAGNIFSKMNYSSGLAYALGNTGMVHAEQGYHEEAKLKINQAIEILESAEDYYPISVYLTYMADIYANQNDLLTAFEYAKRSLDLAETYGLIEQTGKAHLKGLIR